MPQYWIIVDTHMMRFQTYQVPWLDKTMAEDAARDLVRDFPSETYHVVEADSSMVAMQILAASLQDTEFQQWRLRKRRASKWQNHHLYLHTHPQRGRKRPPMKVSNQHGL